MSFFYIGTDEKKHEKAFIGILFEKPEVIRIYKPSIDEIPTIGAPSEPIIVGMRSEFKPIYTSMEILLNK